MFLLMPDKDVTENRNRGEPMHRVPLVSSTLSWVAYSPVRLCWKSNSAPARSIATSTFPNEPTTSCCRPNPRSISESEHPQIVLLQADNAGIRCRLLKFKWHWVEPPVLPRPGRLHGLCGERCAVWGEIACFTCDVSHCRRTQAPSLQSFGSGTQRYVYRAGVAVVVDL